MATRFAGSKIANFLGDKPNYDEIGSQATIDAAKGVANTALNNAKSADAIRAGGQAQATASMAGSIGSAIGGLGSSIFSGGGDNDVFSYAGGPGSSGTALGAGGGVVGGRGTLGPNYGIPQ